MATPLNAIKSEYIDSEIHSQTSDVVDSLGICPIFFGYIFWLFILPILVQSNIQKAFSCTLQAYQFF
jgi:hypothetical protein